MVQHKTPSQAGSASGTREISSQSSLRNAVNAVAAATAVGSLPPEAPASPDQNGGTQWVNPSVQPPVNSASLTSAMSMLGSSALSTLGGDGSGGTVEAWLLLEYCDLGSLLVGPPCLYLQRLHDLKAWFLTHLVSSLPLARAFAWFVCMISHKILCAGQQLFLASLQSCRHLPLLAELFFQLLSLASLNPKV